MKREHASSCATSIHSSSTCAWRMSPGPQTTVEMPSRWKMPASEP